MIIYKITNLINDKIYVGKQETTRKDYLGSGTLIKKAIKKYGRENFKKEILEYCETKEELNEREIYWIEKLNAIKEGYNIATGGEGGDLSKYRKNSLKNKTYDEIYGNKKAQILKKIKSNNVKGIKNPMFGTKLSKEHLEKMKIGKKNSNYIFTEKHKNNLRKSLTGRKLSVETKNKMSNTRKGKSKSGIKLLIYDKDFNLIKKCESIKIASEFTSLHYRTIQRCLYKGKNVENFIFKIDG